MKITKQQKERILELDPYFFIEELECGKWYRGKKSEDTLVFKVDHNGYGTFEEIWGNYWSIEAKINWVPANRNEVESMLIREAKKRNYTTENTISLGNVESNEFAVTGNYYYCDNANSLYSNHKSKGGKVLFKNGQWASKIKTITKAEAERILKIKII